MWWDVGASALDEMIAMYIAEIFPELEDGEASPIKWDKDNEYHVSNLSLYVHLYPHICNNSSVVLQNKQEWVLGCNVLHEIKSNNNAYVFPVLPNGQYGELPASGVQYVDELTKASAPIENMEQSLAVQNRLMKSRRLWYENRVVGEQKLIDNSRMNSSTLLNIHIGCTVKQILSIPELYLPGGLLTILVYPKQNKSKAHFMKKNVDELGYKLRYLNPDGRITDKDLLG